MIEPVVEVLLVGELLQRLTTDPRTPRILAVALTAAPETSDVLASHQPGVNSDIVQPVDLEQFGPLGPHWLHLNYRPAA